MSEPTAPGAGDSGAQDTAPWAQMDPQEIAAADLAGDPRLWGAAADPQLTQDAPVREADEAGRLGLLRRAFRETQAFQALAKDRRAAPIPEATRDAVREVNAFSGGSVVHEGVAGGHGEGRPWSGATAAAEIQGMVHGMAAQKRPSGEIVQRLDAALTPPVTHALLLQLEHEAGGRGPAGGGFTGEGKRRPQRRRNALQWVVHQWRHPIAEYGDGTGLGPVGAALEKLAGGGRLDRSELRTLAQVIGAESVQVLKVILR